MHPATVRVRHPSGDGYLTINVSDLRDDHVIHSLQAEGFDFGLLSRPTRRLELDPAVRDLAAEIGMKMASMKAVDSGEPFDSLDDLGKLERLREMNGELDAAFQRHAVYLDERHKLSEAGDLEAAEARARSEADASLSSQVDDIKSELTEDEPKAQDTPGVNEAKRLDTAGTQDGQSTNEDPGQSSRDLRVEANRGYYYVWEKDEKVSKGFRDFDDAKLERDRLLAES